jgi:hypothetical protein
MSLFRQQSTNVFRRLERLEAMPAEWAELQWVLYRVSARNIARLVERFGVEGLALEQGVPCTDELMQEMRDFLSILEEDTEMQIQQKDIVLQRYFAFRGEDPLNGYYETMQRLLDCGLIASVEEDVF